MSLALMGQVWFCLLSAFGLGPLVGWLGKKLSDSQKPPISLRRDEVLAQNRERLAKEREIATQISALRTQVEIATTALQSRKAALAKLETDLGEQFATLSAANTQIEKLQTRITATEDTLQQNTQSATTLGVDSVTELTKCTAETLHQKFLDVNAAKRLSRILPILAQIRDWIEQAKDLPHSGKEPHLSVIGQTS